MKFSEDGHVPQPKKFDSTMEQIEQHVALQGRHHVPLISRPKVKKFLKKGSAFYRHAMHLSYGMMGGKSFERQGQSILGEDNCDFDIICDDSTLEVNF